MTEHPYANAPLPEAERTEYLIPPLDDEDGMRDWLREEMSAVFSLACEEDDKALAPHAGGVLRRLSSYDVALIADALARHIAQQVQCSTGWRVSPDGF